MIVTLIELYFYKDRQIVIKIFKSRPDAKLHLQKYKSLAIYTSLTTAPVQLMKGIFCSSTNQSMPYYLLSLEYFHVNVYLCKTNKIIDILTDIDNVQVAAKNNIESIKTGE